MSAAEHGPGHRDHQGRRVFMGVIQLRAAGVLDVCLVPALVRAGQGQRAAQDRVRVHRWLHRPGVYLATLYRQRDSRIGRKPAWGFCTFPNFVLVAMIIVSVSGNVAEAKHTFGGYAVAVIPSVTFLVSLFLSERDAAESRPPPGRQRTVSQGSRGRAGAPSARPPVRPRPLAKRPSVRLAPTSCRPTAAVRSVRTVRPSVSPGSLPLRPHRQAGVSFTRSTGPRASR